MSEQGEANIKRKRDNQDTTTNSKDRGANDSDDDSNKNKNKRKKVKYPTLEELLERPWCYYCDHDFSDVKSLHEHQKAMHFQCPDERCPRRLNTIGGLRVHLDQVHKQQITEVPNASERTRDDIHTEVFAMVGIPQQIVDARTDCIVRAYHAKETEHYKRTGNPLPGSGRQHESKQKPKESKEDKLARIKQAKERHRLRLEAEKAGLPFDDIMTDAPPAVATPAQGPTPPVSSDPSALAPFAAPPNAFSPAANTGPFPPPVNAPGFPQQPPMMSAPGMPPMPLPTAMASRPMPMPMSPAMQLPGFGPPPMAFSPAHQRPLPASFQPPPSYGFPQGPPPMAPSPIGQQNPPSGSFRPPNGHGLPPKPNVPFPARMPDQQTSYGLPQRLPSSVMSQGSNPDVDDMINQIATTGQYKAVASPGIKAEPLDSPKVIKAEFAEASKAIKAESPDTMQVTTPLAAPKSSVPESVEIPKPTEASTPNGAPKASDTKKSKSKSNKDEQQLLTDNMVSWEEKRARNSRYQVRRDTVDS